MHLIVNLAEMFCLLYLFAWPMSLWVLVLKAVKTFEITEMIWRSDMKLRPAWNYFRCVSMKKII